MQILCFEQRVSMLVEVGIRTLYFLFFFFFSHCTVSDVWVQWNCISANSLNQFVYYTTVWLLAEKKSSSYNAVCVYVCVCVCVCAIKKRQKLKVTMG